MRKHQNSHCGVGFSSFFRVKKAGAVKLTLETDPRSNTGCCLGRAVAAGAAWLRDGDPLVSVRVLLWALWNRNLQSTKQELCDLVGSCWLSFEQHFCCTRQTGLHVGTGGAVGLEVEQEKKGREEGQEYVRGVGWKSNAVVVFSHGNYLLLNNNMKSKHSWRFGTSNSIQGPLWVLLLPENM